MGVSEASQHHAVPLRVRNPARIKSKPTDVASTRCGENRHGLSVSMDWDQWSHIGIGQQRLKQAGIAIPAAQEFSADRRN